MKLQNSIKTIAPTLSVALSGPLAASALKVIAQTVTGSEVATEHQICHFLSQGITLDLKAKLYEADCAFKADVQKLSSDRIWSNTVSEIMNHRDTQSPRKINNENRELYRLGIVIMFFNALVMIGVLLGCFALLVNPAPIRDESMKSIVSALIGTIVGYVAANAQQVVGYFFGSSKGSTDKTDALAAAACKKTE